MRNIFVYAHVCHDFEKRALYLYSNKLLSQSVYVPKYYIIFPD